MSVSRIDIRKLAQVQFEADEVWGRLTPPEIVRTNLSSALMPQDALAVLDVGCGDGRVTNLLVGAGRFVVGCDVSGTALSHVQAYRVKASVDRLPFKERSFDAVAVFEVLEHLHADTLCLALSEIKRVARRYVLISVPYCERKWAQMVQCAKCEQTYNAYGHFQSFSIKRLRRLFMPELCCTTLVLLSVQGYHFGVAPDCLYWVAKRLGGAWSPSGHALCPQCGANEKKMSKGNIVGFVTQRVIWRIEAWHQHQPTWVLALYERRT